MFNKKNLEAYYFIDQINKSTISTILKFRNISLIYMSQDNSFSNIQDLMKIKEFSTKNNLKFYVTDNIRLAIKVKANGIYLTKNYNRMLHNYNYKKDFF
jgi:thiamine-phosphate pyrophosphorylase